MRPRTFDPTQTADLHVERAAAVIVHRGAQGSQRIQQRSHGTQAGSSVAVEGDGPGISGNSRQEREWGDKAHDSARQAAVDVDSTVQRAGRDRPSPVIGGICARFNRDAEGSQGRNHQVRVSGNEPAAQDDGSVGQGREHKVTVGQ